MSPVESLFTASGISFVSLKTYFHTNLSYQVTEYIFHCAGLRDVSLLSVSADHLAEMGILQ